MKCTYLIWKPVVGGAGDQVLGELEEGVEQVGGEVVAAALGQQVGDHQEPTTCNHLRQRLDLALCFFKF